MEIKPAFIATYCLAATPQACQFYGFKDGRQSEVAGGVAEELAAFRFGTGFMPHDSKSEEMIVSNIEGAVQKFTIERLDVSTHCTREQLQQLELLVFGLDDFQKGSLLYRPSSENQKEEVREYFRADEQYTETVRSFCFQTFSTYSMFQPALLGQPITINLKLIQAN